MDYDNLSGIMRIADGSPAEIKPFLSYAVAAGTIHEQEVPDPYYDGRFDAVYDLVYKGADALLDHIRQQHNL